MWQKLNSILGLESRKQRRLGMHPRLFTAPAKLLVGKVPAHGCEIRMRCPIFLGKTLNYAEYLQMTRTLES